MPTPSAQNLEISLSLNATELAQVEAFATLHGLSVAAFARRATLEAAHVAASKPKVEKSEALWMSETRAQTPEQNPKKEELFEIPTLGEIPEELQVETPMPPVVIAPKRGVAGEPSSLAKGKGPVWEIRRALGKERVHGLGWTREHLAFVLKLSVVGVRKMEHMGTSPVKSLEARQALLKLARTLENPTPAIGAFIQTEAAALEP